MIEAIFFFQKGDQLFAQKPNRNSSFSKLDSLEIALKKSEQDTNRIKCLNGIAWEIKNQNADSSISYSQNALQLAEKLKWNKGIAQSYHNIGLFYFLKADYNYALDYYKKALLICALLEKETPNSIEILNLKSKTMGYMGLAHSNKNNVLEALDYYFEALKIDEKTGNKIGVARHLGNIGIIYQHRNNFRKAEEYYLKALKMAEETNYKLLEANTLGNLGLLSYDGGDQSSALDYYFKALKMADELGYKQLQANTLGNIADLYLLKGNIAQALSHYFIALKIKEEMGDKRETALTLKSIGNSYLKQKNYPVSEKFLLQARGLADSLMNYDLQMSVNIFLAELYEKTNRWQKAYESCFIVNKCKDSLFAEQKLKDFTKKEMDFEYAKKTAADSIKNGEEKKVIAAQLVASDEQLKRETIQLYTLYGGLALLFIFGGFMYNRFRIIRKQNEIISNQKSEVEEQRDIARYEREKADEQKNLVEEKNKEITDSITYAKRLQEAILPPQQLVKEYFRNSFILYKPKDIVAGDFYFFETTDDNIFMAAADCTGHGVPGALVSVVCSNALHRCVKEFNLKKPGEILDKTRDLVLETFTKSGQDVKDGMDISLCVIAKSKGLNNNIKFTWSGANNPLWFLKNGVITEISANKQPVGKTDLPLPFTTHSVELTKGDSFYLFTDGYADQFGGPKRKKFKYKQLQDLLLNNKETPMEEQGNILERAFEEWRTDLEQVDDVCMIGVKL